MIYIKIDDNTFYDDAIVLVRSFYPRTEVTAYKESDNSRNNPKDNHKDSTEENLKDNHKDSIEDDSKYTSVDIIDTIIDIKVPDVTGLNKSQMHDKFKSYLYDYLSKKTGKTLPWGYLTGVRPSKIAYMMLEDGESEETIKRHFMDKHKASEQKAELALNVARKEMDILNRIDYKNGYSLYIGIPFCPSICLYCSFSSYALGAYKDYVDSYLDALIKEMEFVSGAMKGRRLDTVYFGGGTPTTLSAAQLDRLITELKRMFDIDGCHEFTVEAGRPDSITLDKLKVLKKHNVGRISINPQTMNDETLRTIGRAHNAAQVKEAFAMARQAGFDNINMDLIAGLPGEDLHAMKHTLEEIRALAPESLTVHSLAIKRAANLNQQMDDYKSTIHHDMDAMHTAAQETAQALGMEPYYLYRQKNIGGNLENVGYAKPGCECLYNILIMEEMTDIIAAGAGASTKLVYHAENRVERVENCKSVDDYINRFDEMLDRKRKAF